MTFKIGDKEIGYIRKGRYVHELICFISMDSNGLSSFYPHDLVIDVNTLYELRRHCEIFLEAEIGEHEREYTMKFLSILASIPDDVTEIIYDSSP